MPKRWHNLTQRSLCRIRNLSYKERYHMTTLSNIIDNLNAREAQRVFKDVINNLMEDFDWTHIKEAMQKSELCDVYGEGHPSSHPFAKRMEKATPSQLMRSMNAKGLALLLTFADEGQPVAQAALAMALGAVGNNPAATYEEAWPFSDDAYAGYHSEGTLNKDISHLIDVEATGEDDEEEEPAEVVRDDELVWDDNTIDIANMAAAKASGGKITDLRTIMADLADAQTNIERLTKQVNDVPMNTEVTNEDGSTLTFDAKWKNAQDVFKLQSKLLDFDIRTYDWSGHNPKVPNIDPNYKFDIEALSSLLFSWKENVRSWVGGPTGSGKSTLIEQACAYTFTELFRYNCDKESSRYNLIGKVDASNGETYFKDGVLPKAMERPSVFLIDEADAALGDITMALQPVLEGNPLLIGEDGGRIVMPHPAFRITATANTYGSGDSSGMYAAGVKIQSRASMNRYGVFIQVDYMSPRSEMKVVNSVVPNLSKDASKKISDFLTVYRTSFKNGAVQTPISPRNTITMARIAAFYEPMLGCAKEAVSRAVNSNVILSADEADADVIRGIADKTLGS